MPCYFNPFHHSPHKRQTRIKPFDKSAINNCTPFGWCCYCCSRRDSFCILPFYQPAHLWMIYRTLFQCCVCVYAIRTHCRTQSGPLISIKSFFTLHFVGWLGWISMPSRANIFVHFVWKKALQSDEFAQNKSLIRDENFSKWNCGSFLAFWKWTGGRKVSTLRNFIINICEVEFAIISN